MTHLAKGVSFVIQTECYYMIEPSSADYSVDDIVDLLNKGSALCNFNPELSDNSCDDRDIFIIVNDNKEKIGTVLDSTLLDTNYYSYKVEED